MSDDCEKCGNFIDGGNPFSKFCDECLDLTCSICKQPLDEDSPASYFDPARCDDCNFNVAIERGEIF